MNLLPFVIRYLLPYELYIKGREYGHLFTKTEAGREPKKAEKPSKLFGKEDKASIKHTKKSEAEEQRNANLQPGVILHFAYFQ